MSVMPAEDDRIVARDVLAALDLGAEDRVEVVARVLHEARTKREKELRNALKKLGGERETRVYQAILLDGAHTRTKASLRRKAHDCDAMKQALVTLGWTREQILAALAAPPIRFSWPRVNGASTAPSTVGRADSVGPGHDPQGASIP